VVGRLKPAIGFAHLLHLALQVVLPVLVFILVRLGGQYKGKRHRPDGRHFDGALYGSCQ
jgi:hypothetical protein